MNIKINYSI